VVAHYSLSGWDKRTRAALGSAGNALFELGAALVEEARDPDEWPEHEDLIEQVDRLFCRVDGMYWSITDPDDIVVHDLISLGTDADPIQWWVVVQLVTLGQTLNLNLPRATEMAYALSRFTGASYYTSPEALQRAYQRHLKAGVRPSSTLGWIRQLRRWTEKFRGNEVTVRYP
jgi:hypothetical protein